MTPPVVADVSTGASRALNLKNIVFFVLMAIVVTLIVSYAIRNTVVLYDNQGRIIAEGEVKPELKLKLNKNT